jgi:hypothetical protein
MKRTTVTTIPAWLGLVTVLAAGCTLTPQPQPPGGVPDASADVGVTDSFGDATGHDTVTDLSWDTAVDIAEDSTCDAAPDPAADVSLDTAPSDALDDPSDEDALDDPSDEDALDDPSDEDAVT